MWSTDLYSAVDSNDCEGRDVQKNHTSCDLKSDHFDQRSIGYKMMKHNADVERWG